MTNSEIKQVLINNDVQHLYHTNTVETALSFLQCGGLLSRGLCIDMELPQTPQYTDALDKRCNIFYDIFFDSTEIQRKTGYSSYGPVLFQYDINVLDIIKEGNIRITKTNPEKWLNTTNEAEKYFIELDELSFCFDKENFGQHITLIDQRTPLSFEYLERIVLSNPQKDNNYLFEIAKKIIEQAIEASTFDMSLEIRRYCYYPRFFEAYANPQKLQKHFSLGGHANEL